MTTKTKKPEKKKTQSSPLTSHERWLAQQLRLYNMRTPRVVRSHIRAEGLEGKSRADVRKMRLSAWKVFRGLPENKGLPLWLVAARAIETGQWKLLEPPVAAGTVGCHDVTTRSKIGQMAVDAVDWGRVRKYGPGSARASSPYTRVWTNGKSGWSRVVNRYQEFLFVVSPDARYVAVQVRASDPVEIRRVFNGRFLFKGQRLSIGSLRVDLLSVIPWRAYARYYRENGLPARVVRQNFSQISNGSGDHNPTGAELCVVIRTADGNYYHPHASCNWRETASQVRDAMARLDSNLAARRQRDQLSWFLTKYGDRIFVTEEDSLAVGNCSPGTTLFVMKLTLLLKAAGPVGAVTAQTILALRDDDRSRMTCCEAIARYLRQQVPWVVQAMAAEGS